MLGHNQQAVGYPGDRVPNTLHPFSEAGPLCKNEGRKEEGKNYFSYFVIISLLMPESWEASIKIMFMVTHRKNQMPLRNGMVKMEGND